MARSAILRHSVRLYGTTEPESIGHAVSSGDIRMPNLVVVDLANRVPVGAHGAVVQGGDGGAGTAPTPQYAVANWNKTVRSQLYSRNPK